MIGIDLQEHVRQLVKQHGGVRAAAKALQIDPAMLSRIKTGAKVPGPETLLKLGLRQETIYFVSEDIRNLR